MSHKVIYIKPGEAPVGEMTCGCDEETGRFMHLEKDKED